MNLSQSSVSSERRRPADHVVHARSVYAAGQRERNAKRTVLLSPQ